MPMLAHASEIRQTLSLIDFARAELDNRGVAYGAGQARRDDRDPGRGADAAHLPEVLRLPVDRHQRPDPVHAGDRPRRRSRWRTCTTRCIRRCCGWWPTPSPSAAAQGKGVSVCGEMAGDMHASRACCSAWACAASRCIRRRSWRSSRRCCAPTPRGCSPGRSRCWMRKTPRRCWRLMLAARSGALAAARPRPRCRSCCSRGVLGASSRSSTAPAWPARACARQHARPPAHHRASAVPGAPPSGLRPSTRQQRSRRQRCRRSARLRLRVRRPTRAIAPVTDGGRDGRCRARSGTPRHQPPAPWRPEAHVRSCHGAGEAAAAPSRDWLHRAPPSRPCPMASRCLARRAHGDGGPTRQRLPAPAAQRLHGRDREAGHRT